MNQEEFYLNAISPLDGRYAAKLNEVRQLTSESAFIRYRAIAEISWFKALAQEPQITELPQLTSEELSFLDGLINAFSTKDALQIKAIEKTINHDVKALEYYLKDSIKLHPTLKKHAEFIHFACTSEDINNIAYGLMLNDLLKATTQILNTLTSRLKEMALQFADAPMLARTHGQTATPTTMGKELAVFFLRLKDSSAKLEEIKVTGKINGATGAFNAHLAAYPEVDWPRLSKDTVESLGLKWQPLTTQIEPHDTQAEVFDALARINTILIGAARDLWGYISWGYFTQKSSANEVGSSTMPHKVNPIDFENAEGNFGLANALFSHMSQKLPISRFQRDLSDSTVQRNIGTAFGYSFLAYQSFLVGLNKLELNPARLEEDLINAWEVLAEPIQTLMRKHNVKNPYETLKELTRGQKINQETLHAFINSLEIPNEAKQRLLALTPANYIGLASELTRKWCC